MGLVGYYQKFIEGLLRLYHPITSLQKKGVNLNCTPKSEDSFRRLKEMLTSAPVLKITDREGNFGICIDACK